MRFCLNLHARTTSFSVPPLVRKDPLYSPDPAIIQSHLDPARVVRGGREYILHNADRSAAGSLILFQDDFDALTGSNVFPILTVHIFSLKTEEYSDTNIRKVRIVLYLSIASQRNTVSKMGFYVAALVRYSFTVSKSSPVNSRNLRTTSLAIIPASPIADDQFTFGCCPNPSCKSLTVLLTMSGCSIHSINLSNGWAFAWEASWPIPSCGKAKGKK